MSDEATPAGGLGQATVRGARWTYLSLAFNGMLQIVVFAVLARLLPPTAFGLLATALIALRAGQTLVQSGLERGLVWAPAVDAAHTSGVFVFSLIMGVGLTGLAVAAALPLSAFFGRPDLAPVIAALSPLMMINAFGLTARGLLRRAMDFGKIALSETLGYGIGYVVVGVPAAAAGLGVYSLVLAILTQAAVQSIVLLVATRHAVAAPWRLGQVTPILGFSFKVSGLGILEYLDNQVPVFFAGRLLGMQALGIYSRSYSLVQLPVEQIGTSLTRVLFSSFSRAKADQAALARAVRSSLQFLAAVVLPVALGVGAAAPQITHLLLGSRWPGANTVMTALCAGSAATILANLLAVMSEATARIAAKTAIQLVSSTVLIVGMLVLRAWGISGVAVAFSISRAVFLTLHLVLASGQLGLKPWRLAAAMGPAALAGGLTVVGLLALPMALPGLNANLILVLQVAAGGLIAGGVYVLGFPIFVRQTLNRLSPVLERRVTGGLRAVGLHRLRSAYG